MRWGGGGGRDEANALEPRRMGELLVEGILVGRQIEDQQPIHPGGFRVLVELREAVAIDRIDVGVEDDGDLRFLAQPGDGGEDAADSGAGGQGSRRGPVG